MTSDPGSLRKTAAIVIALNLAYFCVEVGVALAIHSVSLFADSVDFLEDAALNLLILLALTWSADRRARVGHLLALVLLAPALATIWTAWQQIAHPAVPSPGRLSVTATGALIVNLVCAFLLARQRSQAGSLTRAAFYSARNDVAANLGMILAGAVTAGVRSALPDLVVGLGIILMNADAAWKVWTRARGESKAARADVGVNETPSCGR